MQTQIIIFGTHSEKTKEVFNALQQFQNWEVAAIINVELALEKMHRQKVDMVIFTNEVNKEDESKLRKIAMILNEEIIFLQYNNQPSFAQKIISLLNEQRLQRNSKILIVDDALKNPPENISLN